MDYNQAMEVKQSTGVIDVLYNGSSVWIEEVNGDMATVYFLQSGVRQEVPVQDLKQG